MWGTTYPWFFLLETSSFYIFTLSVRFVNHKNKLPSLTAIPTATTWVDRYTIISHPTLHKRMYKKKYVTFVVGMCNMFLICVPRTDVVFVYSKSEYTLKSVCICLSGRLSDCHEIFCVDLSHKYLGRVRRWAWTVQNFLSYSRKYPYLVRKFHLCRFVWVEFFFQSGNKTLTAVCRSTENFLGYKMMLHCRNKHAASKFFPIPQCIKTKKNHVYWRFVNIISVYLPYNWCHFCRSR